MTPTEKLHHSQRKWTPRLVSYTLVSQIITVGIIGTLSYLVINWMDTTTKSISENHIEMNQLVTTIAERRVQNAIWKTVTTDRVNSIDLRLVKVEKNLFDN